LFINPPQAAVTVLKRSFSNWGIFDLYEKTVIIVNEPKYDAIRQMEKTVMEGSGEKISRGLGVYVCSNHAQKELAIRLQPAHSGMMIGQIKNKKFFPNLNFAELVAKNNPNLNYPYVVLETKSANLVTYGRDIMGDAIVDFFSGIKENHLVIILNKKKEVIGLGKSRFASNLITQGAKITIDNIVDIGTYYLKEENNFVFRHD
jgi:ribosome biogenesis protein Nip4